MNAAWDKIKDAFRREPVAVINSVVGLAEALLVVLTVSGLVEMTTETKAAIVGFVVAVGTVLQTTLARPRVSPVERNEST